jgi:hypothetical protein
MLVAESKWLVNVARLNEDRDVILDGGYEMNYEVLM